MMVIRRFRRLAFDISPYSCSSQSVSETVQKKDENRENQIRQLTTYRPKINLNGETNDMGQLKMSANKNLVNGKGYDCTHSNQKKREMERVNQSLID